MLKLLVEWYTTVLEFVIEQAKKLDPIIKKKDCLTTMHCDIYYDKFGWSYNLSKWTGLLHLGTVWLDSLEV